MYCEEVLNKKKKKKKKNCPHSVLLLADNQSYVFLFCRFAMNMSLVAVKPPTLAHFASNGGGIENIRHV